MANCPHCKKELDKPEKSLKNCVFQIDFYICDTCGHQFKETKDQFSC